MYAENSRICINKSTRGDGPNTKIGQVVKPSDTVFVAEQDTTTATAPSESVTTGYYAVGRHDNNTPGQLLHGGWQLAGRSKPMISCALRRKPTTPRTEWAHPAHGLLVSDTDHPN